MVNPDILTPLINRTHLLPVTLTVLPIKGHVCLTLSSSLECLEGKELTLCLEIPVYLPLHGARNIMVIQ